MTNTNDKKITRLPGSGALRISKADAAERQLRTALWLWFYDFDPVSIHGLACAAVKVLWNLHEKHSTGHKMLRDEFTEMVAPEYRKDYITIRNATENFIKHADNDPLAVHAFNPDITQIVLLDGVMGLRAFNGSNPIEGQAFQMWYFMHNPEVLNPANVDYVKTVSLGRDLLLGMPKPEFYTQFTKAQVDRLDTAARTQHGLARMLPGN